jgi:hypothetical protein
VSTNATSPGDITSSASAISPRLSRTPSPTGANHLISLQQVAGALTSAAGVARATHLAWLSVALRTFLLAPVTALVVGVSATSAAAHDGWFVRVCPAKTETNRIYLAFSGDRQGFSWSWIKGRTPDEIELPRRFQLVSRLTMRGSTTSTRSNIQPYAYVCVGFRDHIVQRMEFDDHEDHLKNWNDTDDCAC